MRYPAKDQQMEILLGNVLRFGVLAAGLVVLVGAVLFLAHHGSEPPSFHVFRGEPTDLRSVGGIVRDSLDLRGRGLIQLGLLLLIATPIARVVMSAVLFTAEHDWRYVMFTLIVLTVLMCSLFMP
jgi:uncharacterized membrane protein